MHNWFAPSKLTLKDPDIARAQRIDLTWCQAIAYAFGILCLDQTRPDRMVSKPRLRQGLIKPLGEFWNERVETNIPRLGGHDLSDPAKPVPLPDCETAFLLLDFGQHLRTWRDPG